jgi:hypothetical protein
MSTRVDTKKLAAAIKKAADHIGDARAVLAPYLVLLTADERLKTLKPGEGALDAVAQVAERLSKPAFAPIVQTAKMDLEAIREDVANVKLLASLGPTLAALVSRLNDTRLLWAGEAFSEALAPYGVMKAHAENDADVAEAIEPMTSHLAAGRNNKKKPADASDA